LIKYTFFCEGGFFMLKKFIFSWPLLIIILLIIVGIGGLIMYSRTTNPYYLSVKEVNVTDQLISLNGIGIAQSTINYKGYNVSYKNEVLFIKFKEGSPIGPFKSNFTDNISFKNKYGKIKEIYFQGNVSSDNRLIWPQNSTHRN
jgi:hypothetical protein